MLGAVTIRTSPLLAKPPKQRPYRADRSKKYKKRSYKRWLKLQDRYGDVLAGSVYTTGNELWCHPDDLARLLGRFYLQGYLY